MATKDDIDYIDINSFTQIATREELTDLILTKNRIKFVLEGRQLVLIIDSGNFYCLDEFCYHAGGPLSLGKSMDNCLDSMFIFISKYHTYHLVDCSLLM